MRVFPGMPLPSTIMITSMSMSMTMDIGRERTGNFTMRTSGPTRRTLRSGSHGHDPANRALRHHGGLMPCPAAFTVLLVCLQLKRATLGFAMVGAFSFGLALTMVATGAAAAWGMRHAERRFRGLGEMACRAPYFSCVLLVILGVYMAWHGWYGLPR